MTFTEKELKAIEQALKTLEDVGLTVEATQPATRFPDEALRWCISNEAMWFQ